MLFDYRQEADYDLDGDITQEEAVISFRPQAFYRIFEGGFDGLVADRE